MWHVHCSDHTNTELPTSLEFHQTALLFPNNGHHNNFFFFTEHPSLCVPVTLYSGWGNLPNSTYILLYKTWEMEHSVEAQLLYSEWNVLEDPQTTLCCALYKCTVYNYICTICHINRFVYLANTTIRRLMHTQSDHKAYTPTCIIDVGTCTYVHNYNYIVSTTASAPPSPLSLSVPSDGQL